jgi:hypothetical protein
MQWGVGGNEGVDELTSAPRCTFTLLLMFPDDSGNKQTAGLDRREAVGPVNVGGSSEAVRTRQEAALVWPSVQGQVPNYLGLDNEGRGREGH